MADEWGEVRGPWESEAPSVKVGGAEVAKALTVFPLGSPARIQSWRSPDQALRGIDLALRRLIVSILRLISNLFVVQP